MNPPALLPLVLPVVAQGLASLAAAMGIGRFAFTPLLPLMQQQDGLSLAQGAWLAAANYLGYLVGAIAAFVLVPSASKAVRFGLLAVAASTAAMAIGHDATVWLVLRFVAGVASAFVLVGVSGHALAALAAAGRQDLSGWVFAGVGCGIVFAGLAALGAAAVEATTSATWLFLGGAALAVAVCGWSAWLEPAAAMPGAAAPAISSALGAREWALVVAYGGFGLGYIVPATFLPAMARALVGDPLVFGWAWPLFGLAAAASTVAAARCFGAESPRRVFIGSLAVMAFGVVVPLLSDSMAAILLSTLCVGGTFMVATMAGFQQARRIVRGSSARLIAAMTAAFAAGQLIGPALVGLGSGGKTPLLIPSLIAAATLAASACILALGAERTRKPLQPDHQRGAPR